MRWCSDSNPVRTNGRSNQWNPTTPVLIPSKAIFAELCIMQVVTGYLLRATEEDQAQQLKVFGGLGFP